jgi:hypothetical protein
MEQRQARIGAKAGKKRSKGWQEKVLWQARKGAKAGKNRSISRQDK